MSSSRRRRRGFVGDAVHDARTRSRETHNDPVSLVVATRSFRRGSWWRIGPDAVGITHEQLRFFALFHNTVGRIRCSNPPRVPDPFCVERGCSHSHQGWSHAYTAPLVDGPRRYRVADDGVATGYATGYPADPARVVARIRFVQAHVPTRRALGLGVFSTMRRGVVGVFDVGGQVYLGRRDTGPRVDYVSPRRRRDTP